MYSRISGITIEPMSLLLDARLRGRFEHEVQQQLVLERVQIGIRLALEPPDRQGGAAEEGRDRHVDVLDSLQAAGLGAQHPHLHQDRADAGG